MKTSLALAVFVALGGVLLHRATRVPARAGISAGRTTLEHSGARENPGMPGAAGRTGPSEPFPEASGLLERARLLAGSSSADRPEEMLALIGEIRRLDVDQANLLLRELEREAPDEEAARAWVPIILDSLASRHPELVVRFCLGQPAPDSARYRLESGLEAIRHWARRDPRRAAGWLSDHADGFPDGELLLRAKGTVLRATLGGTPEVARGLLGELARDPDAGIGPLAIGEIRNEADRHRLLDLLRELPDGAAFQDRALSELGRALAAEGIAANRDWLTRSALPASEVTALAAGLTGWRTRHDTGEWLSWLDGKLPDADLATKTGELMAEWTKTDYNRAAGWLNQLGPGPLKDRAVSAFVTTLAPHEPDAAAEWAATLPEGKERDAVFRLLSGVSPGKPPD